jgi:hypothetical protein
VCAAIWCNVSDIGLDVSFICNLSLLILYIWYFSNVLKYVPFFGFYDAYCVRYSHVPCLIYDSNIRSCYYYT